MYKIRKLQQWNSMPYKEKGDLYKVFTEISDIYVIKIIYHQLFLMKQNQSIKLSQIQKISKRFK